MGGLGWEEPLATYRPSELRKWLAAVAELARASSALTRARYTRPSLSYGDRDDLARRAAADLELVRAAERREPAARAALAERLRCVPRILRLLNERRGGLLGDHDLEDLVQDTDLKILQKLEVFRGHATLEGWIYRFCLLELMNRLRSQVRRTAMEPTGMSTEPAAKEHEEPWVERDRVEACLEAIPPAEAEVLRLRLYDQHEFGQIAERLGVPLATVRSRYYRGLRRVQERLGGQRDEP